MLVTDTYGMDFLSLCTQDLLSLISHLYVCNGPNVCFFPLLGGGAYKYMDLLTSKLGLRWDIGLSKDRRKKRERMGEWEGSEWEEVKEGRDGERKGNMGMGSEGGREGG